MLRSAASKAMSVGRFASAVFGLALVLALMFGVASMALAANGQPFLLGKATNAATALTKLTANVNGSAMQVQNTNAGSDDTALNLTVQEGEAPMRVNSDARVPSLNADKIDGKDSVRFLGANAKAREAAKADFATFAGEAQNAQGADKLDGKDSAAFFSGRTYQVEETVVGQPGPGGGSGIVFGCDNGDLVLNGGYEDLQSGGHVVQSAPLADDRRLWSVAFQGDTQIRVRATCADFPPLKQ